MAPPPTPCRKSAAMVSDASDIALDRRRLMLNPVTLARETVETAGYHWRNGNINWHMTAYVALVHAAAVVGLATVRDCKVETLVLANVLWALTGFGITSGVHRLWAHRSYDAHWSVRVLLMLLNSMANQGSIYHWSKDHRVHHKQPETDADPYNATRGFFFAHMGWLFVKKHPDVARVGRTLSFADLEADPVVMFQFRLGHWFALPMCFVLPGLLARLLCGEDFWRGVWVAGALRYCVVLHCTWLVNSAAHMFGDHPYDNDSWASENSLVSLFAGGEGWHNWHHKYPFDYAASEFGVSTQFNPSKMVIDLFAKLGLVTNRKRVVGAWAKLKERRDIDGSPSPGIVKSQLHKS